MDQWRAISRRRRDYRRRRDGGQPEPTGRHRTLSSSSPATDLTHGLRYRLAIGSPPPPQCHTPVTRLVPRATPTGLANRLTHSGPDRFTVRTSSSSTAHQQSHTADGRAKGATHTCARPRTRVRLRGTPFPSRRPIGCRCSAVLGRHRRRSPDIPSLAPLQPTELSR